MLCTLVALAVPLLVAAAVAPARSRSNQLLAANKLYPEPVPAFPEDMKRIMALETQLEETRAQLERARVRTAWPGEAKLAAKHPAAPAIALLSALGLTLWVSLGLIGTVRLHHGLASVPAGACIALTLAGGLLSLVQLARVCVARVKQLLGMDSPRPSKLRCYRCRDIFDSAPGAPTATCPYCGTANKVQPVNFD